MEVGKSTWLWLGGGAVLLTFFIYFFLPDLFTNNYSTAVLDEHFASANSDTPIEVVKHVSTPDPVRALYMTSCVAGTPAWRESLKKIIEDTELNSIVIDIKDYTGTVTYPNDYPRSAKGCEVSDLKEFVESLHEQNIYVIGRVSVFQDLSYSNLHPELAVKSKATGGVWRDRKGISFIDVSAKPYWDYIVGIATTSYALGFDELNFDYVRYPSDGEMDDANFTWSVGTSTKAENLEKFFSYLHDKLANTGMKTSVDIFGMTTTVTSDMGIGQVLERALPYFDYIAPMVYPSHYPATWSGFANPAEHPYEVVKIAMSTGRAREMDLNIKNGISTSTPTKLRTWIQDFNLGATYGADKVQAQIQASEEVGVRSWMVWSAANRYTVEALRGEF